MKTRPILIFLLLLFLHSTAQAALAIYVGTGKATFYGNSQTLKSSMRGYLVVDADTLDAYTIKGTLINGSKSYFVRHLQNYRIGTANAGNAGYSYLARAADDGTNLESVFLKGKTSIVVIAEGRTDSLPRTLSGPSRSLLGSDFFGEFEESYTLDAKSSKNANASGFSIQDFVSVAEAILEKFGYSPNPSSP